MLALKENLKDLDRLKRRSDFLCARDSGLKWVSKTVILQAVKADHDISRVGYTVTKKLGNAVRRNRIKRRLRAAAAGALPKIMQPGFDYVLIARAAAFDTPFSQLQKDIGWCVKRLHEDMVESGGRSPNSEPSRVEFACGNVPIKTPETKDV